MQERHDKYSREDGHSGADGHSREFGDYQTPLPFCRKICRLLQECGYVDKPQVVLEPTCGLGNFLSAAAEVLQPEQLIGIELNPDYAAETARRVPDATIITGSIFALKTKSWCQSDRVLILGNPPWVTSSDLRFNLPAKSNFRGLRGIEALTGASNFDIAESVIVQLLEEYRGRGCVLTMLCKLSAARRILLELKQRRLGAARMEMLQIEDRVFNIAAAYGLLIVQLRAQSGQSAGGALCCAVRRFADGSLLESWETQSAGCAGGRLGLAELPPLRALPIWKAALRLSGTRALNMTAAGCWSCSAATAACTTNWGRRQILSPICSFRRPNQATLKSRS